MKKPGKRKFSTELRNKVVLEVLRKTKTVQELASQYDIHPSQIMQWKKAFEENSPVIIGEKKAAIPHVTGQRFSSFAVVDKLQVEIELFNKRLL